ncbi:MAG TPA: glycosyl hydrolase family 28 protein [Paludibacter sp.]|nr:glycosyl hydrolase family 28 protein [Paludibacter sp.]
MKRLFLIFTFIGTLSNLYSADFLITNYGVGSDSTLINTTAIQSVIDKAELNGGGTIVVPKGVYLSGALFFKPNTKLRLEEGAKLKGSDNIADYPLIPSRMEGKSIYYYAALVNAYHVDNFEINGPGTIDGDGLKYWKYFWFVRDSMKLIGKSATNLEVHRPRLLFIWGSDNVKLSGVKLHNSGFWTTHLYQCNDVLIENCDIRSPFKPIKAPSTDGVDIDVCKRVTIRKCVISVNDDAVCIKGGKGPTAHELIENGIVEDILVEDCDFGDSHGVLTFGSESIHARNVLLRNCTVNSNTPLLRIKMRPDTYQLFENIRIENVTGTCGTIVELKPWKQFFTLEGKNVKPKGIVRNITLSNINVKCNVFAEIKGNPDDKISNFVFENVTATAEDPTLKSEYKGIKLKNVVVNGKPLTMKKKKVQLNEHTYD